MKKFDITILMLLILLIFATSRLDSTPPSLQILRPGNFHGDEVAARSGEEWWGLFTSEKGCELRRVTIFIDRVRDPIMDVENEKSGKKVSVVSQQKPIFLIKGNITLVEGPIETVFTGDRSLCPGHPFHFNLASRYYYTLETSGSGDSIDMCVVEDYKVKLAHAGLSQTLVALKRVADGKPTLLWAGDIDRDGKLDLFMDTTHHYNARIYTLFLSSAVEAGELVKEVARFTVTGS